MPLVKRVTCLGILFAFEISTSKSVGGSIGYSATEAFDLVRILHKRGLNIRPLGNALYLMVSLLTSKQEIELYLMAIRDGLNQWSSEIRTMAPREEEELTRNQVSLI
jgi:adenosylmethionine-8-amino-7-oxononanoate aminotransferase